MPRTLEECSMMIIAYSGAAISSSLAAVEKSDEGEEFEYLFEEAENNLGEANKVHFEVLHKSASEKIDIDVLFIHAEDQMLNAQTIITLSKKLARIHKKYGK
ncbi:MAG: PTS lactose/cellobiose transporter subunit IIA [Breznakia sp.]